MGFWEAFCEHFKLEMPKVYKALGWSRQRMHVSLKRQSKAFEKEDLEKVRVAFRLRKASINKFVAKFMGL